jgi:SsrA-binding protein
VAKRQKPVAKETGMRRSLSKNRRARYLYEVIDELECGISLAGTEVKGLREGQCSIAESYCRLKDGELWIVGMHIPEYSCGNIHNHSPTRDRRLLAHAHQLRKWGKQVAQKGTTIVPLEVYFVGHLVKITCALCRGKQRHDKRQSKREADDRRDMDRARRRGRM